jgi:limonene-1,2-epoxide hydrolase
VLGFVDRCVLAPAAHPVHGPLVPWPLRCKRPPLGTGRRRGCIFNAAGFACYCVGGVVKPEEVVRAALSAWATLDADNVLAHFSDDAVLVDPIRGLDEIRPTIEGYVKRMDYADIEVLNVAVNDGLVMVERVDRFVYDGRNVRARCMGAFELEGDEITAWRDYFDVPKQ